MSVRLNKLLAQRGIGARRKCDALIEEGAVQVNGRVVREPGTQVEPDRDRITVRGQPLAPQAELRYFVLNKPVGVITTLEDPEGRRTVRDFMPSGSRLFPVGRLDADTSGLLILTNDGELAHHLMHPRYGVTKEYRVRVDRAPGAEALRRLREGVEFEPGIRSSPAEARVLSDEPGDALLQITLHEGRYRQVRRMCEAVGLTVRTLHRSAYGPLRLGPVQRGRWRELSDEEVRRLRAACARPRQRGQVGYRSPRAHGDVVRRLERSLGVQPFSGAGRPRPVHDERGDVVHRERPAPRERPEGAPDFARRDEVPRGRPTRGERPVRRERPEGAPRARRAGDARRDEVPRGRPTRRERPARRERPEGAPGLARRDEVPRGRPTRGERPVRRGRPEGAPRARRAGDARRDWNTGRPRAAAGRRDARRGRRQGPAGGTRDRARGPRFAGQNPRRSGRPGATGRPARPGKRPRGR